MKKNSNKTEGQTWWNRSQKRQLFRDGGSIYIDLKLPLLCFFEQGYKDALTTVQSLRVNYSTESKKCEALESHLTYLKRGYQNIVTSACLINSWWFTLNPGVKRNTWVIGHGNDRLRRMYTETLFKFTNQVGGYLPCTIIRCENVDM